MPVRTRLLPNAVHRATTSVTLLTPSTPPLEPPAASPLQWVTWRGLRFLLKRDDLSAPYPGNKGRKLAGLVPSLAGCPALVSHGGAQSNAMLALARLARHHALVLHYHTRPLPRWLRAQPNGNLAEALALGMQLVEGPTPQRSAQQAAERMGARLVPQGAAMAEAEVGLAQLAHELQAQLAAFGERQASLLLPSGTGATALYLQRHLAWPVYTLPCVGTADYLRRQWHALAPEGPFPHILDAAKPAPFGRPRAASLAVWRDACAATGVTFDLLYDPIALTALLAHGATLPQPLIYLHCGGVEGNETMLARYRREGILEH